MDQVREEAKAKARSGLKRLLGRRGPSEMRLKRSSSLGKGAGLVLNVVVKKIKAIGTQRKKNILGERR